MRARLAIPVAASCLILAAQSGFARELPPGFVHLRDVAPGIAQDIRYAGRHNFTGSPLPGYESAECIVQAAVARALKRVQTDIALSGLSLKMYDCYRPLRAVAAMARWANDGKPDHATRYFYPRARKDRLFALGYISRNSAHARGVAVDLTLVRSGSTQPELDSVTTPGACKDEVPRRMPDNSLDMGTGYDCLDPDSSTDSRAITAAQRANRALLVNAMQRRGFRNYRREWWHFSFPAADGGRAYDSRVR